MPHCIDLENVQQHKRLVFSRDVLENLLDLTRDRRQSLRERRFCKDPRSITALVLGMGDDMLPAAPSSRLISY